jgi:hypothetical protein
MSLKPGKGVFLCSHTPPQKFVEEAERRGYRVTTEGVDILGIPVGTDRFIVDALKEAAEPVSQLIELLQRAVTLGRFDSRLASQQGLYHLTRDCLNAMLRHLNRAVNPALTKPVFAAVDAQLQSLSARILGITQTELADPTIQARLELPGRHGGLGLASLTGTASASFLGCMEKVAPAIAAKIPALNEDHFPGLATALVEAQQTAAEVDEAGPVPPVQLFLTIATLSSSRPPTAEEEPSLARNSRSSSGNLGRRVQEARWKLMRALARSQAGGLQAFAMDVTNNHTSADFLYMRTTHTANRVEDRFFITAARLHLGLPITASTCYICDVPEPCRPNGDHSAHNRGGINKRHTLMKDVLFNLIKHVRTASAGLQYTVEMEMPMADAGFSRVRAGEGHEVPDITLLPRNGAKDCMVVDIAVVHPRPNQADPGQAVEQEAKNKRKSYSIWNVPKEDMIPLIVDTYGGVNKDGLDFIEHISALLACGDADRLKCIRRSFRERMAFARVIGQGRLIEAWNRNNSIRSTPSVRGPFLGL